MNKFFQMSRNLKVILALMLVVLTIISCRRSIPTLQGDWKTEAQFIGQPRQFAVSFTIGNYAYVGTGYSNATRTWQRDFYRYDMVNNRWTPIAVFPGEGRQEAVAFSSGGKGYVGTGYNGNTLDYLNDFYSYDPTSNTWTRIPDLPGPKRKGAVSFNINDTAYVGTGFLVDSSNRPIQTQLFSRWNNNTQNWDTTVAPYAGPQVYSAWAFVLNGTGYVAGGIGNNGVTSNSLFQYYPKQDRWVKRANIDSNISQLRRGSAVAFVIPPYAYVSTGSNSGGSSDTYQYDFKQDTWIQVNSFEGGSRLGAIGFTIPTGSSFSNGGYPAYLGLGGQGVTGNTDLYSFNPFVPQILNN